MRKDVNQRGVSLTRLEERLVAICGLNNIDGQQQLGEGGFCYRKTVQVCDLGIPESSTVRGSSEFEEVNDVNMFFSDRGMDSEEYLDGTETHDIHNSTLYRSTVPKSNVSDLAIAESSTLRISPELEEVNDVNINLSDRVMDTDEHLEESEANSFPISPTYSVNDENDLQHENLSIFPRSVSSKILCPKYTTFHIRPLSKSVKQN
ncbi:uncharacterized protein LOC119078483 [Bradysia coprophila]|uniref:uncharacterized protein LOC119078483 n=1 Tax=Bradysia coprophila TaxID=38358 RepID=UPI00187DD93C|nr:uncharacterized protein LOC119078483 [Bradysia coprophila]